MGRLLFNINGDVVEMPATKYPLDAIRKGFRKALKAGHNYSDIQAIYEADGKRYTFKLVKENPDNSRYDKYGLDITEESMYEEI